MANVPITDMPVAIGLTGVEDFPVVQGGVNKRAPINLVTGFSAGTTPQSANTVYAGPSSGAATAPAFRAIVPADLPSSTSGYALTATGAGLAPSFQGFVQSGSSPATRTWQAKNRDVFNVLDFGATVGGVVNAYSAFQNAIDAAGDAGGGTVNIPPGVWLVSSILQMRSDVELRGSGYSTIIRNPAGALPGKTISGVSVFCSIAMVGITNAAVRNLTVDHFTNVATTNGIQIGESGASVRSTNCFVEECQLLGTQSHQYLIYVKCSDGHWIRNNHIVGYSSIPATDTAGIEVYGCTGVLVEGNECVNCAPGIIVTQEDFTSDSDVYDVRIVGNRVYGALNGIHVQCGGAPRITRNVVVANNTIRGCTNKGLFLALSPSGTMQNVAFVGNTIYGSGGADSCISVDTGGSSPVAAKGLTFVGNATFGSVGMYLNFGDGVVINANTFANSNGAGVVLQSASDVVFINNAVSNPGNGNAIEFATLSSSTFGNNSISGYTACGIITTDTGSSGLTFCNNSYLYSGAEVAAISAGNVPTCISQNEVLRYAPTGTPFSFGSGSIFAPQGEVNFSVASSTTQNNLALPSAALVRFSGATGAWELTGMANGFAERVVLCMNNNSYALTVKIDSASSSVGNRLRTYSVADMVVPAYGFFTAWYNAYSGDTIWMVSP